jgi:4-hydroxybenzoate polyprenyltransferase
MSAPQAAQESAYAGARLDSLVVGRSGTLAALSWAGCASTLQRLRGGEGALLAVNLSLIALWPTTLGQAVVQVVVSLLTIGLMYAFNDLYDAPTDRNNPKKDLEVVSTYAQHRRTAAVAVTALQLLTIALALGTLGPRPAAAVAAVMLVNLLYSTTLKAVPVLDVFWCGLWGALYAAIVTGSLPLLVVVALMTAVCHLFQALDDRGPDAANGSNVLVVLCFLLFVALRAPLGTVGALTAFAPLVFFLVARPRVGWLLSKAYFGVMWLYVLGVAGAAG